MVSPPNAQPDDIDAVLAKFRANGGRVTTARRAIVTVLLGGDEHRHYQADDIAAEIQQRHPDIAVSTVYRSLEALTELGVVEHIHVGHGPAIYHLTDERHLHLSCRRCGTVIEVPDETFAVLAAEIRQRHGFEIEPRRFAVNGVCRACAARDADPLRA